MDSNKFASLEMDLIDSILGEFVGGIYVENLKETLGGSKAEIYNLFARIRNFNNPYIHKEEFFAQWGEKNVEPPLKHILQLSPHDIDMLKNCFEKITDYLPEQDFAFRLRSWNEASDSVREKLGVQGPAYVVEYCTGIEIDSDENLEKQRVKYSIYASEQAYLDMSFEERLSAAELGNAIAQYVVGFCYQYGRKGAKKNPTQAQYWYEKSAHQGHPQAQRAMGEFYDEKDDLKAIEWYQKSAQQGDAFAAYFLGILYEMGGKEVPEDLLKAKQYYEKSSELGLVYAQYSLALFYQDGDELFEKDDFKALKWYRKAAEQGHEEAMFKVGLFYREGWAGLELDLLQARAWFEKAYAHGDSRGKYALRDMDALNIE